MNDVKNTSRGFSMAEVLVATALLSIILLALFGLVTAGIHRAYGGKKMTEGAVLAEAIMERVNVAEPQFMMPGDSDPSDESVRTKTWTKTSRDSIAESAEGSGTPAQAERDRWRTLFLNAPLPASAADPAILKITVTALPEASGTSPAATFGNCVMARITIDLTWAERGTRPRHVHLQALNVPKED